VGRVRRHVRRHVWVSYRTFNLTRGSSQQQEQIGPSINLKIRLTLEEIYAGKEHEVTYNRKVICPHCRGTGADDPTHVK